MAHELTYNARTGKHEIFTVGSAWHKLSHEVTQAQNLVDAMRLGQIDWNVVKRQVYVSVDNIYVSVPEHYAIVRDDNNVVLGVVGEGYEPIQNSYHMEYVNALLESNGQHFHSAGSCREGRVVFASALVGEMNILQSGDIHKTYLNFVTSHDSTLASQFYLSSVQQVCMNTIMMALSTKKSATVKVKHTKNAQDRLEQAKRLFEGQIQTQETLQKKLETLAMRKITKKSYEAILEDLFPGDSTRTKNVRSEVTAIAAHGVNAQAFPDFRHTAYGVLCAITDYADNQRSVRVTRDGMTPDLQRAESAIFGSGFTLKEKALERILVLTDGSEVSESAPIVSLPPRNVTPKYQSMPKTSQYSLQGTQEDTSTELADYDDSAFLVSSESKQEVSSGDNTPQYLVTTAPSKYDRNGTVEQEILEKLETVVLRLVSVPTVCLFDQIDAYKNEGYYVASQKEHNERTAK